MKAALGVRLGAAAFLAGAFAGALAATFLAGAAALLAGAALVAGAAFLAGVFFAVAMMKFLRSEEDSPLRNGLFTATSMLIEKESVSKLKNHFYPWDVAVLPLMLCFF
jgi:hypothetical protein